MSDPSQVNHYSKVDQRCHKGHEGHHGHKDHRGHQSHRGHDKGISG